MLPSSLISPLDKNFSFRHILFWTITKNNSSKMKPRSQHHAFGDRDFLVVDKAENHACLLTINKVEGTTRTASIFLRSTMQ
jgi:predicted AlkP superfamily pyrophosphatase or phosphodiesterase